MENFGDFCGFSFNGTHCSTLNFTRVSDGSRYNDTVLPNFQDKTAQVPGGDGTYYWDTNYISKEFNIQIAFNTMTETDYRKFRQVFNGKEVGELIFDETPYKTYMAKVSSAPQLNTICFMENGQRIYKGEGSISFISYYPFAKTIKKYLDLYDNTNKDEWASSSGLLDTKGELDGTKSTLIKVYNPGDLDTDIKIYINVDRIVSNNGSVDLSLDSGNKGLLTLRKLTKQKSSDTYICINSKTNLIEGVDDSFAQTGSLYNQFANAGDFFKIPVTHTVLNLTSSVQIEKVEYDYLFY